MSFLPPRCLVARSATTAGPWTTVTAATINKPRKALGQTLHVKKDVLITFRGDAILRQQFEAVIGQLQAQKHGLFNQMKFLWKNTCGLEISIQLATAAGAKFEVSGRLGDVERFE